MDSLTILLKLYCNSLRSREFLKVTGNIPELGSWNPANALMLVSSARAGEEELWEAGVIIKIPGSLIGI